MIRTPLLAAVGLAALALAACEPSPQQQMAQQQQQMQAQLQQQQAALAQQMNGQFGPAVPGAPGQPGVPGQQPAPYNGVPNASGWPSGPTAAAPGMPGQPGMPGGGALAVRGAPEGMQPVPSQAGHVFTTAMNGSASASQLSQALVMSIANYFDAPPQVVGQQADPSDQMAQVGFQTSIGGVPVMGMISTMSNGQGGGQGVLMFDRADRFQQTAPIMMQAVMGGM